MRDGASALRLLAADSAAQRVVTAYVISGGFREAPIDVDGTIREPIIRLLARTPLSSPVTGWHRFERPVRFWLEAIEDAGIKDVDAAERFALAAYQAGEMNIAAR